MTLQSSGAMSSAQIANELDISSGAIVVSTASTSAANWLADRTGLSCIIPTHFYGKRAFKLVDSKATSTQGSSFSTTMNFDPAFSGRDIFLFVAAYNADGDSLIASSITVAGAAVSNFTQTFEEGAHGVFAGIGNAAPAGTSGTVAVTFNHAFNGCWMATMAGVNIGTHVDSYAFATDRDGSGHNGVINMSANGILMQMAVRWSTVDLTMIGTNVDDVDGNSGSMHITIGSQNRLGAQTNRPIGYSGADNDRVAFVAKSYV